MIKRALLTAILPMMAVAISIDTVFGDAVRGESASIYHLVKNEVDALPDIWDGANND